VLYAVRHEMALTLDDVVMRRTGVGQLGKPDGATLDTAAKIMAGELRWNDAERMRQIAAVQPRFELQAGS
jgi:glycerol-3-phosphate dehydrogenase